MAYILHTSKLGLESMPEVAKLLGIKAYKGEDLPKDREDDYAFRWGATFYDLGKTKVVNKIKAIEEVKDKKGFRLKLAEKGLAPITWGSFEDYLLNDSYKAVERVLIRPATHQRSEGLFACTSLYEAFKAIQSIEETTPGPYYISELIQKAQEYRVFVFSGRIAAILQKIPDNKDEVSWGCIDTGTFKYVDWSLWPKEVTENALKSMALSSLDFGAVDIIVDGVGKAYSLEVNTAPFLSPYYQKCVAKCFKHIIENGREHFPMPESFDWKSTIHPAIMKDL